MGVALDYVEAARWLRLAAQLGLPSAETNLAYLYEQGRGLPLDYVAAYTWYSRALAAGDATGAGRQQISHLMTRKQIDEATSLLTNFSSPSQQQLLRLVTGPFRSCRATNLREFVRLLLRSLWSSRDQNLLRSREPARLRNDLPLAVHEVLEGQTFASGAVRKKMLIRDAATDLEGATKIDRLAVEILLDGLGLCIAGTEGMEWQLAGASGCQRKVLFVDDRHRNKPACLQGAVVLD